LSPETNAWSALHGRLARAKEAGEGSSSRSREAGELVLRSRAERFARVEKGADAAPGEEYLAFRLAGRDFLVESSRVAEVASCPDLLPVPGAPDRFEGVIVLRGALVTVLDLPAFLGLGLGLDPAPADSGGAPLAVVLFEGGRTLAFRAGPSVTLRRLEADLIRPVQGSSNGPIAGMGPAGEIVLDAGRLHRAASTAPDPIR
jgi:chemotaxis signal transduction protein